MVTSLLHPRHRIRLADLRARTRIVAALAIGYVPLVVLGVIERLVTGQVEPLLTDPSVHLRLLVVVPLFLLAETALTAQAHRTEQRLVAEGYVTQEDRPRFNRLVAHSERLRRSPVVTIVLLAIALFLGLAALTGRLGLAGAVGGPAQSRFNVARVWFGVVSRPLSLFVLGRSLVHCAVWVRTLVGIAGLRLRLVPAHPDGAGGIRFLTLPSLAFFGPFLLGVSTVLCASWGTQVVTSGVSVRQFLNPFVAFALLGEVVTFAPLLAFTPRLFLASRTGRDEYGGLATDYVRRFDQRWLGSTTRDELLGSGDIQSLNDLGGAYRELVVSTRPLLFGLREMAAVLVFMALPIVPLLFAVLPVEEVVKKLVELFRS